MTDFDRKKEDLLARVDMVDLVDSLGLERKGKEARCPAHDDHGRPNLHIYPHRVHCFSCGFDADAFGLVTKVKGLDFKGAFDFLAGRYGLPLIRDYRKSGATPTGRRSGLGRAPEEKTYPKPAPLPDTPSPTLVALTPTEVRPTVALDSPDPWPSGFSDVIVDRFRSNYQGLPVDDAEYKALWGEVDRLVEKPALTLAEEAWLQWVALRVGFHGEIPPVKGPQDDNVSEPASRPSLRTQVFAALLGYTIPSSKTTVGAWLTKAKGITSATQDRFRLCFLADWGRADVELRRRFGPDTLDRFGLLTKEGRLAFTRHGFLFPFYWKGEPVDVQGRDVNATDKNFRFLNTRGSNPIPYNADAILQAREKGEPLYLCEGATDTLTLAQSGRLAIGIVGTQGFKASWLPYFAGLKVFLAFDADDAGKKGAAKVSSAFFKAGYPAPKVVKLPDGVKDVNEFFRGIK